MLKMILTMTVVTRGACLHVINMNQIKYGYFVCHMNYKLLDYYVQDDLDDDGDVEGREQQKECARGRD